MKENAASEGTETRGIHFNKGEGKKKKSNTFERADVFVE